MIVPRKVSFSIVLGKVRYYHVISSSAKHEKHTIYIGARISCCAFLPGAVNLVISTLIGNEEGQVMTDLLKIKHCFFEKLLREQIECNMAFQTEVRLPMRAKNKIGPSRFMWSSFQNHLQNSYKRVNLTGAGCKIV